MYNQDYSTSLKQADNMIIPPIGIGGIGGSGTRVFADILIRLGVNLGSKLNKPLDNLVFSSHFKRPGWFEGLPQKDELIMAWSSFLKVRVCPQGNNEAFQIKSGTQAWGWKEPNTHIFLPFLNDHVDGFKYIHVLRNGLDMAFSNNQQQVTNWGKFILRDKFDYSSGPSISLDYWIAANTRAIKIGKSMGDRFLLVMYDELCKNPVVELQRLASFIGHHDDTSHLEVLIKPTSIGRHLKEDLSVFSDDQLQSVESLMHASS